MKAISFLEYYHTLDEENGATNMLCDLSSYYNKVSQSFSFEKVAELFEGFVEKKSNHSLYHADYNIEISIEDKDYHDEGTYMFYNHNTYNPITPIKIIKTIDEFIVLCNNLNMELQWKI